MSEPDTTEIQDQGTTTTTTQEPNPTIGGPGTNGKGRPTSNPTG
jgi:hypothetical protein